MLSFEIDFFGKFSRIIWYGNISSIQIVNYLLTLHWQILGYRNTKIFSFKSYWEWCTWVSFHDLINHSDQRNNPAVAQFLKLRCSHSEHLLLIEISFQKVNSWKWLQMYTYFLSFQKNVLHTLTYSNLFLESNSMFQKMYRFFPRQQPFTAKVSYFPSDILLGWNCQGSI